MDLLQPTVLGKRLSVMAILLIVTAGPIYGQSSSATVPFVDPREQTEAVLDAGQSLHRVGDAVGSKLDLPPVLYRAGALFGEAFFVHEYGHIRTANSYGIDSELHYEDSQLVVRYDPDGPVSDPARRHLAGGGINMNELSARRYARSDETGAYLMNQFYGTFYALRARSVQRPDRTSDPINYERNGGASVERQFWTGLATDLLSGRTHEAFCELTDSNCSAILPTFQTYYTPEGLSVGAADTLGDYRGQLTVRDEDWSARIGRTVGPLRLSIGGGSLDGETGLSVSGTYERMLTKQIGLKLRVDQARSHLFYNQIRAQDRGTTLYGALRVRW